jgi:transposase
MVRQKMYRRIQQRREQGLSISEIARELRLDRKTTAKYFHMGADEYRRYCRSTAERHKRVNAHKADILAVYRENGFVRLNMAAVYDYLVEIHGELSYTEKTLRNYLKYLRENGVLVLTERVRMSEKVPELPFGRQLQVDFGRYRCPGGLVFYIFSAVLSASRYKYMAFQDRPFTTEDVIGHLLDCFSHLGGCVVELVIDQDPLLVTAENAGDIIYTKKFGQFIEEMDLVMYVCRKADPQSKGKVENSIKYVKQNFLAIRDFEDLEQANTSLHRWLKRRANGSISQATKRIPAEMLETEREHLRPLRNSIFRKDACAGREPRVVNEHCYVSVGGSQYSAPSGYRGRSVEIYQTPGKVFIFDQVDGAQLAEHAVAAIPGTTVTERAHFRSTERSARQLREIAGALVDLPLWRRFERKNAERFPRYVRDQALEAKQHFSHELDLKVLTAALAFCLENQTLSYANLKDTYAAFLTEAGEAVDQQRTPGLSIELPSVQVSRRSLEDYQSIVVTAATGA